MDDYDDDLSAWEDYDDEEHPYDCDCNECDLNRAMDECGLLPMHLGGGCQLAGTEHCDFECPFRDNPDLIYGDADEAEE